MRRVLAWAMGLGLMAGAALLVGVPAGGQTAITFSWTDFDLNGVLVAVSSVDEDGAQVSGTLRATVTSAPSSNITISVTVGASGSTATRGSSCTAPAAGLILGLVLLENCGGDYGVYANSLNNTTFNMTIMSGQTTSNPQAVYIKATPDRITENNEIIRISGTTTASGYSVSDFDITLNDADRTILFTGPAPYLSEPCGGFPGSNWNGHVRADVGSGTSRGNFVRSTSSTLGQLNIPIVSVDGTAVHGSDYRIVNLFGAGIRIWSRSVRSTTMVHMSGVWAGTSGNIYLNNPGSCNDKNNTVAAVPKTFQLSFNVPSGYTALGQEYVIYDEDSKIVLSVDTDSGEDGDQVTLAEGASGSGVTVSADFPTTTTSSTIGSAKVMTLSAAGEASPSAGEAGTGDLSYAPSSPNTITIPARSTTVSGTATLTGLTIADDMVVEGPETFTVGGSSDLGAATGAEVTIVDDDTDIALTVSPEEVAEGPDGAEVTVTARFAGESSVLRNPTEVTVTLAGADTGGATLGADFTVSGTGVTGGNEFTVSIPAGELEGSATVRVTAPVDADSREVVAVSGEAEVGGMSVDVTGDELDIVDPGISLSFHEAASGEAALSGIGEGGGQRMIRVRAEASARVSGNTTVAVTVGASGGTAASCTGSGQARTCPDFTPGADTVNITIPDGRRRGTADVTITPVVDTVAEGTETIRFSGTATGYVVTGADLGITETIELTLSGSSVDEGAGNAGAVSVTAGFPGAASSTLTGATDVTLSFTRGAGAEAADFTAPAMGSEITLRIPMGDTASNATALSRLGITEDMIAEGPEVIAVEGSAEGFAVTGTKLTIADDDLGVTLEADTDSGTSGEQKSLSEGATASVRVRASLGSGVTNELDSDLTVSVTAREASPISAAGGGVDFTAPGSPAAVTIPVGQTQSGWVALAGLRVTDDTAAEGAETFRVTGAAPGVTVTPDTLTIGASDDEIEVSVSPGTVEERATPTPHTITVTVGFRDATSSGLTAATAATVTVASGDGNGASLAASCPPSTEDACVSSSSFTVSIPAGQTSGNGTFDVTAREDGSSEAGGETLKVTGTVASNSDSATLRIVDSGVIRVAFLNPADDSALSSVAEGDGAVSVRVRVTMPSATTSRRVVGLDIAGDTATEDDGASFTMLEDFRVSGINNPAGIPSGHELGVEVPANQTTGTADFTITINDDNIDEDPKTIRITGADVGSVPVVGTSLTITDNDNPPANIDLEVVSFQDANGAPVDAVMEDGGTTRVRVRASYQGATVLSTPITVPITVGKSSDGAASGTDYQAVTGAAVTIPAHQSRGEGTFNLIIGNAENDASEEGPETVTIDGVAVTGFSFTYSTASFTIVDDDLAVHLALLNASGQPLTRLREGEASQTVTVRASYTGSNTRPGAQTVRVNVGGGTASASDYRATSPTPPFELTIPGSQNDVTGTFALAVTDDSIDEEDETLAITGELERFAVIPATLTIVDNDDPPTGITLSVDPSTVRENRGSSPLAVTVTARLSGSRRTQPTPVRVTIGGAGSTASRSDYQNLSPSSLTITIPAEQSSATGNFRVTIRSDSLSEQAERIAVTGVAAALNNVSHTAYLQITNVNPSDGGGGGGAPPPSGGGGGGAPPPSGGGGGGGGGGGAPPPVGPVAPPPPPAPVCQGRFCDDDGSVHEANIEQIAAWEITLGCDANDATKYCPSAQITRRQMAAFLYRAVSQRWTIQPPEDVEISDVPADAWYRTFADWVVSTGAFAAPGGVFNPGGVVTRADMAVMMIASFPHIDAVEEPEGLFNDVEGADPAVVRAVEGMYHSGVTKGCSTTPLNYCPNQPVTRAQMASFFVRAVNLAPAAAE